MSVERKPETAHDRVADEEIAIYHITKRERTPARDRLTPRMEARRLIDALDAGRMMRDALREGRVGHAA